VPTVPPNKLKASSGHHLTHCGSFSGVQVQIVAGNYHFFVRVEVYSSELAGGDTPAAACSSRVVNFIIPVTLVLA
jgi:hypothetical protein